ncbi:hypothetical protein HMPREF9466_02659 [Fusobacterium necrophorum subsp. funduliforme 1_1_36S]|nr:hypothetical protein HMPREF9466_02659 [Fusobacterium necrophorum subsp. funduliforme 1_1_36S]
MKKLILLFSFMTRLPVLKKEKQNLILKNWENL